MVVDFKDSQMYSDKFMLDYTLPELNMSDISTESNYVTVFNILETNVSTGNYTSIFSTDPTKPSLNTRINEIRTSALSKPRVRDAYINYRNTVHVGNSNKFKSTDTIYFKVDFGASSVQPNVTYIENTLTIPLTCSTYPTYQGNVALCKNQGVLNTDTEGGFLTIEGTGYIAPSGSTTQLVAGNTSAVTNIVLEPFEAFLDQTRFNELKLNNTERLYNNVYYIDLITVDMAGNNELRQELFTLLI